jgi:RNA polymerase sigma factor (sigma-70 family)
MAYAPAVRPARPIDRAGLANAGDAGALDDLFARHYGPLRRWTVGRLARRWQHHSAESDDLVQNALLHTFLRMNVFQNRGDGALAAYLRRAVINGLRDEIRRVKRQPEMVTLDAAGPDKSRRRTGPVSPLARAMGDQHLEDYRCALARLKPGDRAAIVGRTRMGYTYRELARILGKPTPEAARKTTARALLRLADELRRLARH